LSIESKEMAKATASLELKGIRVKDEEKDIENPRAQTLFARKSGYTGVLDDSEGVGSAPVYNDDEEDCDDEEDSDYVEEEEESDDDDEYIDEEDG